MDNDRTKVLEEYRKKLVEHREAESRLKEMRESFKNQTKLYDKSENDLKALQVCFYRNYKFFKNVKTTKFPKLHFIRNQNFTLKYNFSTNILLIYALKT